MIAMGRDAENIVVLSFTFLKRTNNAYSLQVYQKIMGRKQQ